MLESIKKLVVLMVACLLGALGFAEQGNGFAAPNDTADATQPDRRMHGTMKPKFLMPKEDGGGEFDRPLLHNLLRISDSIYCGGQPASEQAFTSLSRLGVKTVVSVDGAKPDVATARRYGLRYVHIPMGYEGVGEGVVRSFKRLVRDADGPFYIHCHHGRHRGPAAAAIACVTSGIADGKQALAILELAGTSQDYAGLWRDVENCQVPADDAELPVLREIADVGTFTAAMASIDRAYHHLKLCRDAAWATPDDHPDLIPAQLALLLKERLRESARNLAGSYDEEFKTWLLQAGGLAQELENGLRTRKPADEITEKFRMLEDSCKRCHETYRN